MLHILKSFWLSITVTIIGLLAAFSYGGFAALYITVLLIILEVTLSFDNAVVNARVLKHMTAIWQRRFLTWGILIAVFGTRFLLPIVIVSVVVWMSPIAVAHMAIFDPDHYGELLHGAKYAIDSFGAAFLMMVALKYFLDSKKTVHWFKWLEQHLSLWGRVEAIEIILALLAIAGISFFVPDGAQATVLLSGIIGVVLFVIMQGITSAFSVESKEATSHSIALFAYLEVLDAAFSLDGVIGAFALTSSIVIIAVGLGIGALFVRSLTVYMVKERSLETLTYLEHGAHWAILGLAGSMLISLLTEVPEVVTGTIGLVFVVAAYYSSILLRKKQSTQHPPVQSLH